MTERDETAREPRGPGHHEEEEGYGASRVLESERRQVLLALARGCQRHGYEAVSAASIAAEATVAEATLRGAFGDAEGVLDAAAAELALPAAGEIERATQGPGPWEDRVIAGIAALLDRIASEPELARLAFVEAPRILPPEGRGGAADSLLEGILDLAPWAEEPGELAGETLKSAIVGGMREPLVQRLRAGQGEEVRSLAPELAYLVITACAGPDRAMEFLG